MAQRTRSHSKSFFHIPSIDNDYKLAYITIVNIN